MAKEIRVPDIGDFADVDVIEILVAPGDTIAADDALITLESDKASMEVPAPEAGTVTEIKLAVGDKVSEGSLILMLEAAGGDAGARTNGASTAGTSEPAPPPAVTPAPAPPRSAPAASPAPASTGGIIYASPSVRKLAREKSIDLSNVPATGPKGRITKADLENFLKGGAKPTAAAAAPAAGADFTVPPIPAVDFSQFGEIETVALSRIQKISGPRLHAAWLNIPMVTHHDEADTTELEDFRKSLKVEAEKRGVRVTALAFIMKALADTLASFPKFNTSLSPDGQSLIYKKFCHIGIAVDTPNGLVVPVIRDVDRKGIFELSADLAEMSGKARDGKLGPKDMQGGSMSISSLGGIGGTAFTPIVNAPEVAILGVTRSQMKPVWNGSEFVPRLMLPLDLTYDHRVIDGADGARFTSQLVRTLGDIRRLIL